METPELRLKCLELALVQAKMQGDHADIEKVAQIHGRFYALVMDSPVTAVETPPETDTAAAQQDSRKTKPKADKTPEIFK